MVMKFYGKDRMIIDISKETEKVTKWECPCCGDVYYSEDNEDDVEFYEKLYKEHGVRKLLTKYMEGIFCQECYEDDEFKNSSL